MQSLSNAQYLIQLAGSVTDTVDLFTAGATFSCTQSTNITNGTTAEKVNIVYTRKGKIAIGGSVSIDLIGSVTDVYGDTVNMDALKILIVKNTSSDNGSTAAITLSTDGIGFISDSGATLNIPAYSAISLSNLNAGWTLTDESADTITLTNADAQNGAWFELIVAGVVTSVSSSSSSSLSSLSSSSS
jgi:hypothetical protein